MLSEFDLIKKFFTHPTPKTALGVGDDAALITPPPGRQLVISTDMLVEKTHFFTNTPPARLGWKTLAVSVSDLAAMGAQPHWATLSLSLPNSDNTWLSDFASGFMKCANTFKIDLIGGDTTRGPRAMSVTLFGNIAEGKAVLRSGAQCDDEIWVSGTPGMAALGLACLQRPHPVYSASQQPLIDALELPQPRLSLGQALIPFAHAMLDISDGLLGDLRHILSNSQKGAIIQLTALPLTALQHRGVSAAAAREAVLCGGDDYELLFCVPPEFHHNILQLSQTLNITLTNIGHITDDPGTIYLEDDHEQLHSPAKFGYDHFSP